MQGAFSYEPQNLSPDKLYHDNDDWFIHLYFNSLFRRFRVGQFPTVFFLYLFQKKTAGKWHKFFSRQTSFLSPTNNVKALTPTYLFFNDHQVPSMTDLTNAKLNA